MSNVHRREVRQAQEALVDLIYGAPLDEYGNRDSQGCQARMLFAPLTPYEQYEFVNKLIKVQQVLAPVNDDLTLTITELDA